MTTPPPRSVRARWDTLPRVARSAALLAATIAVAVVLVRVADESLTDEEPGGPRSSSYATADQGLAGLAEVLRRFDHDVERVRGPIAGADLSEVDTVFVVDPDDVDADASAHLLAYVSAGGRLVIGGDDPGRYLPRLRSVAPEWSPGGTDRFRLVAPGVDDGRFDDLGEVRTRARGQFTALGSSRAVVGADARGGTLVSIERVGAGTMVFVADVSPLVNDLLATADNAAFGVALAGPDGARVAFMEGVHGYAESSGLASLPSRWQTAFMLLAAAGALAMWARGRRLGPPEHGARPLPPARAEYVDALATTLRRTGRPADVSVPLQREIRRLARARGLASETPTPDELTRALAAAGLDETATRAVVAGVRDDADLLAAARAHSRLSRWSGSHTDTEPRSAP
ncbi:MAG TPA: DUF4350 domain-containing protein [Acidimicrobiia bacterium]|nr:DUF4350 domain-containing protein [Acidimicrobiia bacterium]